MKIEYNLNFVQGRGGVMPRGPGIYAEVYWPTMSLRIGESQNVYARNRGHINWANKHRAGTHNEKETNRRGIIVDLVKVWGAEGLEHFLISDDARLTDRAVRIACEIELHEWARKQTTYRNINTQRGYRS